jgi:hypothetical protein
MKKVAVVFAVMLAPLAAQAQQACPMSYEIFEQAIPHVDLPACPKDMAKPGAFCRLMTTNGAAHVFMFEEKGKKCLLAAKSYSDFDVILKK